MIDFVSLKSIDASIAQLHRDFNIGERRIAKFILDARLYSQTDATCSVMVRSSWAPAGATRKVTPMMTSAPISFATSVGRLFTRPPSLSTRPSHSTGVKIPGIAMVARSAFGKIAFTQDERFSRKKVCGHAAERDRQIVEIANIRIGGSFAAEQKNERLTGVDTGRKREPLSELNGVLSGDAIPFLFLGYGAIFKLWSGPQEIVPVRIPDDSFPDRPRRVPSHSSPPSRPPMLVPAIRSTGIRCSSRYRSTPM